MSVLGTFCLTVRRIQALVALIFFLKKKVKKFPKNPSEFYIVELKKEKLGIYSQKVL